MVPLFLCRSGWIRERLCSSLAGMTTRRWLSLVVALGLAGCAHTKSTVAPVVRATTPEECRALVSARRFAAAEPCFLALPPTDDLKLAGANAYLRATALLYQDDFTRAAKVFADLLRQVRTAGR